MKGGTSASWVYGKETELRKTCLECRGTEHLRIKYFLFSLFFEWLQLLHLPWAAELTNKWPSNLNIQINGVNSCHHQQALKTFNLEQATCFQKINYQEKKGLVLISCNFVDSFSSSLFYLEKTHHDYLRVTPKAKGTLSSRKLSV